jgi:TolA-binding protein
MNSLVVFLCLLILGTSSSCVYFNTFYNAKKYYRQAEKARRLEERQEKERGQSERAKRKNLSTTHSNKLYDKAARRAFRVIDEHSESELVDDAFFLMGEAFYWQEDYRGAVSAFEDLVNNFPQSEYVTRAQLWHGRALEGQALYAEARALYRNLFEGEDKKIAAQAGYQLGQIAFDQEDYVAAMQEYKATLEAFPKSGNRAQLWLRIGEALVAEENPECYVEALAAFDQVKKAKPDVETAYRARLNTGQLFYLQGNAEGALKIYMDLLKKGRFREFEGETRLLIGQYYQERGRSREALDEYERVRDDFPKTPASAMALYRTGLIYLQDYAEIDRAQEYFKEIRQEKAGTEADELGQEISRELTQLDRVKKRIIRADSLVVARVDSLAKKGDGDPEASRFAKSESVLKDLFSVADIYRETLGVADSAALYYSEVERRFPETVDLPRALYALAWVHLNMNRDDETARPMLQRLIETYPDTEQANAARQVLGIKLETTSEELAAAEFFPIETLRLKDESAVDIYVPLLDTLVQRYPGTQSAARAAFVAAWTYENVRQDSVEAERRYALLGKEFSTTEYAEWVKQHTRMLKNGFMAKMERDLQSLAGNIKPGDFIEVLAVEPDSADTVSLSKKYFGFGLRAQRRGDLETAKQQYQLSIDQRQRNADALYRLAEVVQANGDWRDAKDYFRQALTINRRLLGAQYALIKVYTQIGMADSASAYLREVVSRDRNNPEFESLKFDFPDSFGAEPEDLDLRSLEELDLTPPLDQMVVNERDLGVRDKPLVRRSVKPDYPPTATGEKAEVILDILIARDGLPEIVEVYQGEEPFITEAVRAARRYTFWPATKRGETKVQTWVELVISFEPGEDFGQQAAPMEVAALSDSSGAVKPVSAPYVSPYANPYGAATQADTMGLADPPSTETNVSDGPETPLSPKVASTQEKAEGSSDSTVTEVVTEAEKLSDNAAVIKEEELSDSTAVKAATKDQEPSDSTVSTEAATKAVTEEETGE